jgi:hypothetical protein
MLGGALDEEQVLKGDEDSLVVLKKEGRCEGQVRGEVGCEEEMLVGGKRAVVQEVQDRVDCLRVLGAVKGARIEKVEY